MLSFIKEIFKNFPGLVISSVLVLLLSSALESLTLLALVPVTDILLSNSPPNLNPVTSHFFYVLNFVGISPSLLNIALVAIFLQVSAGLLAVVSVYFIFRTRYSVLREIISGSFQDFFSSRWQFFSSHSQGTLLNTFTRAIVQVGDAFGALGVLVASSIRFLAYAIVPLTISVPMTLMCVGLLVVVTWPFYRLGKYSYRLGHVSNQASNQLMSSLHESLGGAKVVLSFGKEFENGNDLCEKLDIHSFATIRFQTLASAIPILYKPLGLTILMILLLFSQKLNLSLSGIGVTVLAFLQMISMVGQWVSSKNIVQNLLPAFDQVSSLRKEAKRSMRVQGSKLFEGFHREIVFKNVSFAHDGRTSTLANINLKIRKGEFFAIVGDSGAGKSTLIDLLMSLHEPTEGFIYVDNNSLKEFEVRSYRSFIGYVPQDGMLFNKSIRENLLWANPNAREEDIILACGQANASEFIELLPQRYDTVVGDRGVRLSGGEAQRIGLARAILRKPELLILDEATSSLDTRSEKLIQMALETIGKDTTVVAVAHRLSTIKNADHIIVIEGGMIKQEGTYAELVNQEGVFREMVQCQNLRESS